MLYIAIVCREVMNREVLRHKRWLQEHSGCVNALKSPAHITLVPPFWLPAEREEELKGSLQLFATDTGEMAIRLHGFGHFNRKVLSGISGNGR